jgi:hypothetical protein
MAKKYVTSKSSRPVRHNTPQALDRAITRATNPAFLRKVANTSEKMEQLSIENRGIVDTTELAVTILAGAETRKLVEWLMQADREELIANVLGCVIAASRMTSTA